MSSCNNYNLVIPTWWYIVSTNSTIPSCIPGRVFNIMVFNYSGLVFNNMIHDDWWYMILPGS